MIKTFTNFFDWKDECDRLGYETEAIGEQQSCLTTFIRMKFVTHWAVIGQCKVAAFSEPENIGHVIVDD